MDQNLHITIKIRCPCNYKCFYCQARNIQGKTEYFIVPELRDIYRNFATDANSFIVTGFECGGSEPTIHPQFREILETVLDCGVAYFPTNNSIDPDKWVPRNHPDRMHILASLQTQGEKDIYQFILRLLYLRELGAHVCVSYVAHPLRIGKVPEYSDMFRSKDIAFTVFPYVGEYQGRKYPESYSTDELETVRKFSEGRQFKNDGVSKHYNIEWIDWASVLLNEAPIRNFAGIPCLAGKTSFAIDSSLKLTRCLYDSTPLDKPYDTAVPCKVTSCGCGFNLEELNTYSNDFWNFYRIRVGWRNLLDKTLDEVIVEKRKKYWELMERYNKVKPEPVMIRFLTKRTKLFCESGKNLVQSLEKISYAEGDVSRMVSQNELGITFTPLTQRDHVSTPCLAMTGKDQARHTLLVTMVFPERKYPSQNLFAFFQDEYCNQISENVFPLKPCEHTGITVTKQVDLSGYFPKIRLMMMTTDEKQTPLPYSLCIEEVV